MITADITYWSLTIKQYCASFINTLAKEEMYGGDTCNDCWLQVILATELIEIMDCYTDISQLNYAPPLPTTTITPCLVDSDIEKLFEQASKIINNQPCN